MKAAFIICVGYATLGLIYAPGLAALVALLFIGISCLPWLVAAWFEPDSQTMVSAPPGATLYWGAWTLGILNVGLIARSVGMSPAELLSPRGVVSVAAASTTARYTGSGDNAGSPLILAVSLFFLFWVGAATRSVTLWRKILIFLPVMLYSIVSTEKWPLFLAGAFFISGIVVAHPYRTARDIIVKVLALFTIVGTSVSILAMVLRGRDSTMGDIMAELLHYVLAPFPAFGTWLLTSSYIQCCDAGAFTFIGPLSALNVVTRNPGIFSEQFTIYGMETNVFTAWRYVVQDFSLAGPFVLNVIIAVVYIAARFKNRERLALAVRYGTVIWATLSLNVTPFVHNSVALTTVTVALFAAYRVSGKREMEPEINQLTLEEACVDGQHTR